MRSRAAILVACALVAAAAPAAAARRARVVGNDPAGDAYATVAPGAGPAGAALGQDLTKAALSMRGRDTVVFEIFVTSLPPAAVATAPTGYVWDFTVNGLSYELIGCTPSVVAGCPEAPVGVMPFQVYECAFALFGSCVQVGSTRAEMDPARNAISIPVPADVIRAVPGSVIRGSSPFGAPVAAFAGEIVQTAAVRPADEMSTTKDFVVPSR